MTTWVPQPDYTRRHRSTGEYVGNVGGHDVTRTLNDIMEFNRVVRVDMYGRVHDASSFVKDPPEALYVMLDNDGDMIGSDARDGIDVLVDTELGGWMPLQGHCGAYGESSQSFIQHPSEFIGGGLEDRIVSTPGYYVAVMVDGDSPGGDSEPIGWTVLHREAL